MSHRWSVTTPRVFHEGRKFHYVCGGFESWQTFAPPRNALHTPFPRHLPRGGMQLSVDLTCVDHKSELDSVVCEVKQFSPSYFFSQHHRGPIYDRPKAAAKGMSKYVFGTPNLNFRTVGILQFSTDFRDAKTTGRKRFAGQCGSRWSWEYEARKWHLSWSTTNFLEMWHIGLKAAGYCKSEKVWVCKLD